MKRSIFKRIWNAIIDFFEYVSIRTVVLTCTTVVLAAILTFIIVYNYVPFKFKGTVVDMRWEHKIEVQKYGLYEESGEFVPEGAEVTRKTSHTVLSHYNTVRTGNYSIHVPVYRTKTIYYYNVYEWKTVDYLVTADHTKEVYACSTDIPSVAEAKSGNVRLGKDYTTLYVTVISNEKLHEAEVDHETWNTLEKNKEIVYKETLYNRYKA